MTVSQEWIPFENGWDGMLVRSLVQDRRQFVKGLRYNLAVDRPLAATVLSDTRPQPVALYILGDDMDVRQLTALRELVEGSSLASWYWRAEPETSVPPLPAREGYASPPFPALAVPGEHAAVAEHDHLEPEEEEPEGEGC